MKNKYTEEQRTEALKFFEEGFSGPEISKFLNIKIGTLYRWKSEFLRSTIDNPKINTLEGINELDEGLRSSNLSIEDLRRRVEVLESYINGLKRAEEKSRNYEEPTSGWKPPTR